MKIEHIQRREGGTKIPMGRETYHFKPEVAEGPHLADVTNQAHAERFLAITEGFRLPPGERPTELVRVPPPAEPKLSNHPPVLSVSGREMSLAAAVLATMEQHGLSTVSWNELSELERFDHVEAWIQAQPKPQAPVTEGDDPATAKLRASDIQGDQKLQGTPEDQVTPQKPLADRTDKQLKALAAKFGVSADLSRPELIAALSAYPV